MSKVDPKQIEVPNINFSLDMGLSEKRAERFKEQRLSRGFDDSEWYNLNYTIASFIRPRLCAFKENTISYPIGLTPERWKRILNQMIKAFSLVEDDTVESKRQQNTVRVGLRLFSQFFLDLWS
jgi:hypothetical protein